MSRAGLALGDSQYQEEARSHLQTRVRAFYGVVMALAGILYLVETFKGVPFVRLDRLLHLGMMLLAPRPLFTGR